MLSFVRDNRRWLAVGMLLTFGSSFGQTWFISLFAAEIRGVFDLTVGEWGAIYTVATLASAGLLLSRGGWADVIDLSRLLQAIALCFAGACLVMALSPALWALCLAVFLLRFCGQGMFTHIAMTTMGRWFDANRGKAVAVANLGHPVGEVLLPLPFLMLIAAGGWRWGWVLAAVLIGVLLIALLLLLGRDRQASGRVVEGGAVAGLLGQHWRRAQILRHWSFWVLLPVILTPGFIGTVVFFHQTHVAEVKGWRLVEMAPSYAAFALATVSTSLVAGWACDRFGPERLLPVMLVPMAAGMLLIGPAEAVVIWVVALGLTGITQGISGALWGALLPRLYGTDHLGEARALVVAVMVLSTALGPGITGLVIDRGVSFPAQGWVMGLWCLGLSAALIPVARRVHGRLTSASAAR